MKNACVKTLEGVFMYFLTLFLALVLLCRKDRCENSRRCVDVFFDVFCRVPLYRVSYGCRFMTFYDTKSTLLVFDGKCMRQNSRRCVDVFFHIIFGVSSLRWIMQAAIVLKTIEDCWCSFLSFLDVSRQATFFTCEKSSKTADAFY